MRGILRGPARSFVRHASTGGKSPSSVRFMPPPPTMKFAKPKPKAEASNNSKPSSSRQPDRKDAAVPSSDGNFVPPPPPRGVEVSSMPPEKYSRLSNNGASSPPREAPKGNKNGGVSGDAEPLEPSTPPPRRRAVQMARHADDVVRLMRPLFEEKDSAVSRPGPSSSGDPDQVGVIPFLKMPTVTLATIQELHKETVVYGILGTHNPTFGGTAVDITVFGPARDRFIQLIRETGVFAVAENSIDPRRGGVVGHENAGASVIKVRGGVREIAAKVERYLLTVGAGKDKHDVLGLGRRLLDTGERRFVVSLLNGSISRALMVFPKVFALSQNQTEVRYLSPFSDNSSFAPQEEFDQCAPNSSEGSQGPRGYHQRGVAVTEEYLQAAQEAKSSGDRFQLPHLERYIPIGCWADLDVIRKRYLDQHPYAYALLRRNGSQPFSRFLQASAAPVGWKVAVANGPAFQYAQLQRIDPNSSAADAMTTEMNWYDQSEIAFPDLASRLAEELPFNEWIPADSVLLKFPVLPWGPRSILGSSLAPLGLPFAEADASAPPPLEVRPRAGQSPELRSLTRPLLRMELRMQLLATLIRLVEEVAAPIGDDSVDIGLVEQALPRRVQLELRDRYGGVAGALNAMAATNGAVVEDSSASIEDLEAARCECQRWQEAHPHLEAAAISGSGCEVVRESNAAKEDRVGLVMRLEPLKLLI